MKTIRQYIQGLTMRGGDHDGEKFKVLPWEKKFIDQAFGTPGDACMTVSRGNGKTCVVAALACCVVDPDGPLHGNRREVDCFAASFEQGRVVFDDVVTFIGGRHDLTDKTLWRKQDSANRAWLEYRPTGAKVRCHGSDPSKAHGLRSYLALLDEPSQWERGTRDRMVAATRTGLGKVPGSKLIALGTRPASSDHWFARLLKSAPYAQIHAAGEQDDPFKAATWHKANPSLRHLPSLRKQIEREAKDAQHDPDSLASFKSLRLNMGVADVSTAFLIEADAWARAEQLPAPDPISTSYVLGVDLGTSAAMSACAAYFQDTRLEALACFPEVPDLDARGLHDGVGPLYQRMKDRGELIIAGRRVSDVKVLLEEALDRWGRPVAIVCDRWREAELRQYLEALHFPMADLILRGQGYKDGGEDVRDFRAACLSGAVRPSQSLLLRSAFSEAVTVSDPAGNAKLAKNVEGGRRSRARDDAASASVLAVGEGSRRWQAKSQRRWRYRGAVA